MPAKRSGDPAFGRALDSARQGSPAGFEWLWRRFARQVTAFARVRGSEDPDGITNDVFLATFQRIDQFTGDEDAFAALLFTIARNKVIDEHRQRGRRPVTTALDPAAERLGGNTEDDALAGLGFGTRELLLQLTDDQREVLILRLVADLSLEQTAAITGRTVNATKALQHRAVNAMRRKSSVEAVTK